MKRPPRWKKRLQDGFDRGELEAHIRAWVEFMGLHRWDVRFSLGKVPEGERAHVDVDPTHRLAAIRLDTGVPTSQVDRCIVHELAHVLMAEMEDQFNRSLGEHGEQVQAFLRGNWSRAQEPVCEWIAELLTESRREEWKDEAGDWLEAFPVSKS